MTKPAPVYFSYKDDLVDAPALLLSDSEDDLSLGDSLRKDTPSLADENSLQDDNDVIEDDRQVRFRAAHIRDYSVTIGDHPACCDCLPLSLDWNHGEEQTYDIDTYENMRETSGRSTRGHMERLGYWEKRRILEDSQQHTDTSVDPYSGQDTVSEVKAQAGTQCDPFSVLASSNWDVFSPGACGRSYPTMTVEVIDD